MCAVKGGISRKKRTRMAIKTLATVLALTSLHATHGAVLVAPPSSVLVIRGGGAANAAPVANKQPAYADNGIVKLIAKTAPKLGLQALALGIFALSFCDEATKTEICSGLWGAWIVADTLLKISSMAKSLRSAVQRLPIVG